MRMNELDATNHKSAPPASRRVRRPAVAASPRANTRKASRQPAGALTDEQIRLRAYQFYLERGGAAGDPVADWLRAERELIAESTAR